MGDGSFSIHLPDALRIFTLTLLIAIGPFILVLMTSFTRIVIILSFLRQALATQVPSNIILIGLSLILTGFVMRSTIIEIEKTAITPYLAGEIQEKGVVERAWPPLKEFMLAHTREKDLELFLNLGNIPLPSITNPTAIPWYCVIPSFVLSELRIAFLMGFMLFLPFLIIDMVVSSILMSMGMMMLPPVMISFPFKLLLFIVVDGWRLVMEQIAHGY